MQWTSRDFPRTADDFVLLILQALTFFDLGWTVKLISGEFVLDRIHQTTGIIISCAKIGYWVALERDEAAMFWCWMCLLFHSIWTPYILQKHIYSLLEFHSIQPFNNGSIICLLWNMDKWVILDDQIKCMYSIAMLLHSFLSSCNCMYRSSHSQLWQWGRTDLQVILSLSIQDYTHENVLHAWQLKASPMHTYI